MISLRQVEEAESVNVEFNEYVPLTITWSSASEVLEPPRYVELQAKEVTWSSNSIHLPES